ncbi:DUF2931 family protein [Dyella terrae]|uniref:DUF2931 family protein n=1 Tax=Dyella terrae TaxID=522259 RepID=UPI001EFC494E|nr:DUF2931 family protein [Dyella terrae]ULU26642.1 DUF2931 protein [Dyella terrae]
MKWRSFGVLVLLVCMSACAGEHTYTDAEIKRLIPPFCGHWAIEAVAPRYMEAWIETLEVKDEQGRWIKIPQGVVGELGQTSGWSNLQGGGGGPHFDWAGAPMEVRVRWQSLAEPQTYMWHFTVPETMRQALVKKELVTWRGQTQMSCRSDITLGVAPGGHTIVWLVGIGFEPMEIQRGQAEVEPLGPWQGKGKEYAYPLSEEARKYVDAHGIPYGSW